MPCISFILPIYNMERLLPRALRALRAQTLTDFEAILINDGSKDGSAALCAQAAAEDARFRFIDQPNGGVAAARNAGLDAARGEYIFFLDPDDWVEPDAVEVLYRAARDADADCVQFGMFYDTCDENGKLLHSETDHCTFSGVYRGEPFKEHFDEMASSYLAAKKMFRRAFLEQHHLRFPPHQLGEDGMFFVAFYRQNPGCLVVLEKPLYHYTIARRGSLSNRYHPERLEDNFYLSDAVWDTVAAWSLQDSPMHRAKASYCTIRDLMMGIKNLGCSPLSLTEQTAWLRSALQKPRVCTAVRSTPLHAMQSRNDRIKLLLLKLRLYRMVLLLSGANQKN